MRKEDLEKHAAEVHAGWDEMIERLGADGLERPNVIGEWRVRDVLAHFNGWDRWQLVQMRCCFTGETPTDADLTGGVEFPANDDMTADAMNRMFFEGNKDRPVADVVADYRTNCELRTDWLSAASQEQLETRYAHDWAGGNRVYRIGTEVPHLVASEAVWERFVDQLRHQQQHLDELKAALNG